MTSQIYVSVTTMGTFVVRIVQYCLMPYIFTQRNCIQLSSWCFPKRISLFLCCYCSRCNGMYFAMYKAMPLNWTEQHIIGVFIHHFVGEMEMSPYLVYIFLVLIIGLRPANWRRRYKASLTGLAQSQHQPWYCYLNEKKETRPPEKFVRDPFIPGNPRRPIYIIIRHREHYRALYAIYTSFCLNHSTLRNTCYPYRALKL